MNLGFATVESGFCRAKNVVTILAKNFVVFAVASIAFLVLGFGLMFDDGNALFGTQGLWFVGGSDNSPAMGDAYKGAYSALNWTGVPLWAKFFFQLVFAGTAATIVSGAVAERVKFGAFYLFSFAMVGLTLSGRRPLDLGRRLARQARDVRFRGLDRRALRGRLGGAGGSRHAGAAPRQVRQGRQGDADPRPLDRAGDDRRLRPLVRLVQA
jgi:hypothetical protein